MTNTIEQGLVSYSMLNYFGLTHRERRCSRKVKGIDLGFNYHSFLKIAEY